MARRKHPKKDIEAALRHAEQYGWRVDDSGHHAWGKLYCPFNSKACRAGRYCLTLIWSTPSSSSDHAADLRRVVNNCTQLSSRS
jgi:hypothetical protein